MITRENRAAIAARMDNARLSLGKFELRAVENWRRARHFGVVQFSAAWGLSCVLIPLLAEHWPEMAPVFARIFPRLTPDWLGAIGAVLSIVARLVIIQRKPPCP